MLRNTLPPRHDDSAAPTVSGRGNHDGVGLDVLAGLGALALVAAAALVIGWLHWYSADRIFTWAPPVFGHVLPHAGPGTPAALALAVLVVAVGPTLAARLPWSRLCWLGYAAAVGWTFALAMIRGWQEGLVDQFTSPVQYLRDVPRVHDIGALLGEFTSHVQAGRPGSWIVQVSGHPPGALLVFAGLNRVGLSGGGWAGLVSLLVGCLAAVAVPATIRVLGAESAARAGWPFAVLFPGAITLGVSADGLFTGVSALGVLVLAVGARRRRFVEVTVLSAAGGMLLGASIFLSYGLVLMGPIALAVCLLARNRAAVAVGVLGALVVVAGFAVGGFWWLDGYHAVVRRYYQDLGTTRPYDYWVWADLAALVVCVGPVLAPGLRRAVADVVRTRTVPVVAGLVLAAALSIVVADVSGLSKAEVERIWLPFAVWLTAGAALLPPASRRWWLGAQAVTALTVGHLVLTNW